MPEQLNMVGSVPVAVRQSIESGGDFDGTLPQNGKSLTKGFITYAEDDQGGMFQVGNTSSESDAMQVARCVQIAIKFGGQNSWSLSLAEAGKSDIAIYTGTNETHLFKSGDVDVNIVLSPGQYLKLVTANASTAMEATFWFTGAGGTDGII